MVDLVFVNEHTLRAFESLIRRDSTGNARGKREQMGKSFDGLYCVVDNPLFRRFGDHVIRTMDEW